MQWGMVNLAESETPGEKSPPSFAHCLAADEPDLTHNPYAPQALWAGAGLAQTVSAPPAPRPWRRGNRPGNNGFDGQNSRPEKRKGKPIWRQFP
jgi:hypothetical protein